METRAKAQPVTTEELFRIDGHFTIDGIYRAKEIYEASLIEHSKETTDMIWIVGRALSNVYEAGRIDGIRQERARRKLV